MNLYWISVIVFLGVCSAMSMQASVTVQELTSMTDAKHPNYEQLRDAIVKQGNSVLPELDRIYNEKTLDWRPRFAAGVCMEHIQKADVLHEMLHCDWRKVPGFDESGPTLATGYPRGCELIVDAKLVEFGCWFYLLELYGGFLPEAETEDYRLFRGKEDLVLHQSTGDIRYFASCIVNQLVERAYEDCPTVHEFVIGWPLMHLAKYIRDGTLPEGLNTIYSHLDRGGRIIDSFVEEILDPVLLHDLSVKYRDNQGVQFLLQNRLQAIHDHVDVALSNVSMETNTIPKTYANPIISFDCTATAPSLFSEEKHSHTKFRIIYLIAAVAFFAAIFLVLIKWRHRT